MSPRHHGGHGHHGGGVHHLVPAVVDSSSLNEEDCGPEEEDAEPEEEE